MRVLRLVVLPLALSALSAAAQGQGPGAGGAAAGDRLRFRAGPFEVIPYIQLGQVAADTNVFYTAEDRRTDITASGGPGLRIALPIRRVRLFVDGNANYYWFARTREERRFGGAAGGGIDWTAGAFSIGVSRFYTRTYDRPSIEVDRRVLRESVSNRGYLHLKAGARLRIEPGFEADRTEVPAATEFLGADLRRSLTGDRYRALLDLKLALTPKTDFVVLADQEWSRFSEDRTRDADSNRLAAGFALNSTTRLSGRAVGGIRLFRPKGLGVGKSFDRPFGEGQIEWILGAKTRIAAEYRYDTAYSAFSSASGGTLPTVETQQAAFRLFRRMLRRIEFEAEGRLTTLKNDAPVVVRRRDGERTIARDDRFYSARGDLGVRLGERLRLGVVATYNERQSNFADFGVDGLLLGASIRFNP